MNTPAGATFSLCKKHRLSLWRTWNSYLPKVLFIMLNPSTGDDIKNDRTISKLIKLSQNLNYGGFYIGNLFSYITPYPDDLKRLLPKDKVHPYNDEYILKMSNECRDVVFAWGNNTGHGRDLEMIKMFPEAYCFQLTKLLMPIHPLYLPSKTRLWKYSDLKMAIK